MIVGKTNNKLKKNSLKMQVTQNVDFCTCLSRNVVMHLSMSSPRRGRGVGIGRGF